MRSTIFYKLARFDSKLQGMIYQKPNMKVRYVLSQAAHDEILRCAAYRSEANGKNYIFGVEFRVDPNIKGIIIAEVIDETY